MRKREKSFHLNSVWPIACAASWFWAPGGSLNPGYCTQQRWAQPCPHLGTAEQLLLLLSVLPSRNVAMGVVARELCASSREAGNSGKCGLLAVADAFVSIVPLLILFLSLPLIFPCATLSWLVWWFCLINPLCFALTPHPVLQNDTNRKNINRSNRASVNLVDARDIKPQPVDSWV